MTAMQTRALRFAGKTLTGVRLASAPLIFAAVVGGHAGAAAALVAAAILTDVLDGPLVRRFGTPSTAGAWFDIWADFAVIVAAFAGLAWAGLAPAWPLLPITASFALFVATARRRPTIYDPVGRYLGGILMGAALLLLTVEDFLVQDTVQLTAAIACIITMAGRVAHVLPRRR